MHLSFLFQVDVTFQNLSAKNEEEEKHHAQEIHLPTIVAPTVPNCHSAESGGWGVKCGHDMQYRHGSTIIELIQSSATQTPLKSPHSFVFHTEIREELGSVTKPQQPYSL